jgi:drug/metabolite transporter (DMT)-like permease
LKNVSTSLVSTYTFINPIVAVLLGTMILGEPFSISMLLGACLVIASVIVMWRAEHAETSLPPSRPSALRLAHRPRLTLRP